MSYMTLMTSYFSLQVCDHKSEHNRFRYIFKQQVISDNMSVDLDWLLCHVMAQAPHSTNTGAPFEKQQK